MTATKARRHSVTGRAHAQYRTSGVSLGGSNNANTCRHFEKIGSSRRAVRCADATAREVWIQFST